MTIPQQHIFVNTFTVILFYFYKLFTSFMEAKINYILSDMQQNVRNICIYIAKYHKRGMLYLRFSMFFLKVDSF